MTHTSTAPAEMVWWQYGPPPSAYDHARNTLLSALLRLLIFLPLRLYLLAAHRLRVRGAAQLRRIRGHLIVANHASHLDALVILAAFGLRRVNRVRVLCAKDYFFGRGVRGSIAFLLANVIPMATDRYDARAIRCCLEALRQGDNVVVFPEGSRSADGRIQPFKPGVGLLALRHRLPVLPAFVRGTYECWNRRMALPRPGRVEVVFGQPVRYRGKAASKDNWLKIARDLRRRVARLAPGILKESRDDERRADHAVEGPCSLRRPAERRHPNRAGARGHLRPESRLHLPQPPVRQAAGRQAT
ncbi:MAG TPA: lysophospholipid acyltransferase family protein [Phycisphaerae bacterium]|nr:lysophospholipid acyltransferase family protein [Phycisphaerae bacterium]